MAKDVSVRIGSLTLKNPLIAASGCFGYGVEYADIVDLATLGGIVAKGLFLTAREGHPAPRIVETPAVTLDTNPLRGSNARPCAEENLPPPRPLGATPSRNPLSTTRHAPADTPRAA